MVYSVGLTLYNLGAKREPHAPWPARPPGRLIWLHAPGAESVRGLEALARRLVDEAKVAVLLTTPADVSGFAGLIVQPPPADSPANSAEFLEHWAPTAAVFADGELRPALLHAAQSRGVALMLVDARQPKLIRGRDGWFPGLTRTTLAYFRQILALDEPSARAFRKAGAAGAVVRVTGRMEEHSAALPYLEAERAAMARTLATRPIWLAADVAPNEEAAVIAAHREALRLSHRLLLILVPQDPGRAADLAARLEGDEGWSVAMRSADQEPEDTEVYIPDSAAEYGLWYRLAPVTFLGGSLSGAGCARNPLEPAALGSAIIYGPRPGPHGAVFGRLGAARAARMVGSAEDLVQALSDLLSPDRAARQAQAAWAVASDGAEVTDRVVALLRQILAEG